MKKLEINIPDNHEIDLDKSNLSKGIIFFKEVKKQLTYEHIYRELFCTPGPDHYDFDKRISEIVYNSHWDNANINGKLNFASSTREQLESILALNKLCNVAKYLNGDWLPKTSSDNYLFGIDNNNKLYITWQSSCINSHCYFKSKKIAQQAIDILAEDEIRKALTLNH